MTFNPGDIVRCIDDGNYPSIKTGAEYTVSGYGPDEGDDTMVTFDHRVHFHPRRFEMVTPIGAPIKWLVAGAPQKGQVTT